MPTISIPMSGRFDLSEVGGAFVLVVTPDEQLPVSPPAWTPLSLPNLFAHFDLSQKTVVFDEVQGRDELDEWPDQSGSGLVAVPITYPADGMEGKILRPRYVASAGDGRPAIDGREAAIGRGLSAPFTAEQLAYFHDGVSPWTLLTNLWMPTGETLDVVAVSTGGYTASNAGFGLYVWNFGGGYKIQLAFSDGTSAVGVLDTVIAPPQASHLAIVCNPALAAPLTLFLNGVEVDEWTGSLPSAAGAGSGYGLCFGNWARAGAYAGSAWIGRHVTICKSALTESQIIAHANWADAQGYV